MFKWGACAEGASAGRMSRTGPSHIPKIVLSIVKIGPPNLTVHRTSPPADSGAGKSQGEVFRRNGDSRQAVRSRRPRAAGRSASARHVAASRREHADPSSSGTSAPTLSRSSRCRTATRCELGATTPSRPTGRRTAGTRRACRSICGSPTGRRSCGGWPGTQTCSSRTSSLAGWRRWGWRRRSCTRKTPGLIIVRVSGFGQTGPYRERPGFGTLVEAMSGFADRNGFPDREPVLPR